MLVSHSHQNEVELVLHKHTSSCYMDAELAGLRRRAAFRNTFEPDAGYLKACAYKKEAAALGSAIPWIEEYLQTL